MNARHQNWFSTLLLSVALSWAVGCSSGEKEEGDVTASEETEAATPEDSQTATAPTTPAPVETTPPGATMVGPPTGGTVMYVKIKRAEVKERPDPAARTVGYLDRGEHVFVQVEGAWAKFGDNKYVNTAVLTDQGVGRSRRKASWGSGK